jgi:hypothetical protein
MVGAEFCFASRILPSEAFAVAAAVENPVKMIGPIALTKECPKYGRKS